MACILLYSGSLFFHSEIGADRPVETFDSTYRCWFILCFVCCWGVWVPYEAAEQLYVKTECPDVDPILKMKPTRDVPTSLISVFAYQFGMIGAGIIMVYKYGCRHDNLWHLIFLVANFLCLPGQALPRSLGPYYECYGSNFWEQVTFASAIVADIILNTSDSGLGDPKVSPDSNADDMSYAKKI